MKEAKGKYSLSGFQGEVWEGMTEKLQLEYVTVLGQQYGSKNENGDWTGMIGMLHRNEADIAIAQFTPTKERYEIVDFIMSFDTHE